MIVEVVSHVQLSTQMLFAGGLCTWF